MTAIASLLFALQFLLVVPLQMGGFMQDRTNGNLQAVDEQVWQASNTNIPLEESSWSLACTQTDAGLCLTDSAVQISRQG